MTDLPINVLKLTMALLKHQSGIWLGDEFVGVASKTIIDIGGEKISQRLNKFLDDSDSAQQLIEAAKRAEDYFMQQCDDVDLKQAFSMSIGDLPSILSTMKNIPTAMDDQEIKRTVRSVLIRDFPNLTSKQHEYGASLFTHSLVRAVSNLKEYTLPIIAKVVLDNKFALGQVLNNQEKMMSVLQRLEYLIYPESIKRSSATPGMLSAGSYLPFQRNVLFTSRENELNKLANLILVENDNRMAEPVTVLSGMAGIGKSQIAIEFCFRYGYKFDGVHWINAGNAKSFSDLSPEIIACGRNMSLPTWQEGEGKEKQQLSTTLHTWRTGGKRLLVFDNVHSISIADDIISQIGRGNIHIIFTSRITDWPSTMPISNILLSEFSETEGSIFFRKHLQLDSVRDEDLKLLTKRLGGLPLALELAGRYLARTKTPILEYIKSLTLGHKSLENWRSDLPNPTKHEINITQTINVSWVALPDEFTRKVFIVCGFFSPNVPVNLSLLAQVLDADLDIVKDAVSLLVDYSLLRQDNSLHPLIAEFANGQDYSQNLRSSWLKSIASYCYPDNGNENVYTNPLLAQHALHTLDALVGEANRRRNNYQFAYHVSFLLRYFGRLDQAKLILEKITKKNNNKLYISGLRSLAWICRVTGKLNDSEEYYKILLSSIKDEVSNLRASILHEFAFVYRSKSQYQNAIEMENQALGLFRKLKNLDGAAIALHELGVIHYRVLGDYDIALSLLEDALNVFIKTNNKHDEAHVYHEMANIYRAKSDLQTAHFYYSKSIEMKEISGDFRGLASTYHEIGYLYVLMQDYTKSFEYYSKALDIENVINDVLSKSNTLHDMGYLKEQMGDIEGAKGMYIESIYIKEKLGNQHGKAATLAKYGQLLYRIGDKEKGLSLLFESRKILELLNVKPDIEKVNKMIQILQDEDPATFANFLAKIYHE